MRPAWHFLASAWRNTGRSILSESFFDELERRPWAGRTRVKIPRPGKRRTVAPPTETGDKVAIYDLASGTVQFRPRDASAPNVVELLRELLGADASGADDGRLE